MLYNISWELKIIVMCISFVVAYEFISSLSQSPYFHDLGLVIDFGSFGLGLDSDSTILWSRSRLRLNLLRS